MLRSLALAAFVLAVPASAQDAPAHDAVGDAVVLDAIPTYSAGMGRTDGPFTLVSFDDGIVVAPDATVRADSATVAWDIGIRGTEIILNGGENGPGGRRGVLTESTDVADGLAVAGLTDRLVADGETECPRGAARVVCHGSGNGWYEYTSNGVEPLDRALIVERPDGSLHRVRFVRYVLGDALPSGVRPRYVTMEVTPVTSEDA